MSTPSRENALDHVVAVMFENRSFDNLLGRLYEPGEVASFEGVLGKDLSNPVPEWAQHRPDDGIVRYGVAPNLNTPDATMREHFNLGAPFTARDASARSFTDIFTLPSPRAPEDWPDIVARPVPELHESLVPLDAPLGLLGKSLFLAVLAMAEGFGKPVPDLKREDPITGAEAIALGHEVLGEFFPAMRD